MGLKESGLRGSIRNVSTGIGAAITIDTLEAENVESDSATIRGEITELTNFGEDAEVFFEFGEITEGLPNTTDIQLQDTVGVFTEDLTNLSEDTTHEFQAFGSVRDVSDEGVVLTFETGPAIPDSVVAQFDASELSLDDSDSVTTWPDELGNYDLTDAGGGDPVYRTDELNGLPVVEFNGDRNNADLLDNTSISSDQPNTIIIVCKHDPVDSTGFVYGEAEGDRTGLAGSSDDEWSWRGDTNIDGGTLDPNEFAILTGIYDGSNSIGRQDGTEVASGDVGTDVLDGISVGGRGDEEFGLNGGIAELRIYDDRLSSSEYESEESNLAEKWGISLD